MPITHEWLDNDLIGLIRYNGDAAVSELDSLCGTLLARLDSTPLRVHFIHDLRGVGRFPGHELNNLASFNRVMRHEKLGQSSMVGVSNAMRFWLKLFEKSFQFRYNLHNTPEEASHFLREFIRIYRLGEMPNQTN